MKLIAGLALALAIAPAASAKATCADYQIFIDAAFNRFPDWRGATIQPGVFAATRTFPGHAFIRRNCTIITTGHMTFVCQRVAGTHVREDYSDLLAEVRSCFPDAKVLPPISVADTPMKMISGARLVHKTPEGEITIGVAHVQTPATVNKTAMVDRLSLGFVLKRAPSVS